jgi:hypothetical protein
VVVIGAGQAGLAIGYFLARQRRRFVILEAADAVGASWRGRWDSLVLFTPRRHDALPGLAFPGDSDGYPTRDEVTAYLDQYAARFDLRRSWAGSRTTPSSSPPRSRPSLGVKPPDTNCWPPVHRELLPRLDNVLIEDGRIVSFSRSRRTQAESGTFVAPLPGRQLALPAMRNVRGLQGAHRSLIT